MYTHTHILVYTRKWDLQRLEEEVGTPDVRIPGSCEPPNMGSGNKTQYVLLTLSLLSSP